MSISSRSEIMNDRSLRLGDASPVAGKGSEREAGTYVVKNKLPDFAPVECKKTSGPELAARELAAFLRWETSVLNFYHQKCCIDVLSPLQSEVKPRRAAELDLEKRLKLTEKKGTLELEKIGKAGLPSHSHPLTKRAACHRLYLTLRAVECLSVWGKETVKFFETQATDKRLANFIRKADLAPTLYNMYNCIEAIGLIWKYPTPPRESVPAVFRSKGAPAPLHPVATPKSRSRRGDSLSGSLRSAATAPTRKAAGADPASSGTSAGDSAWSRPPSEGDEEEAEELDAAEEEAAAKEVARVAAGDEVGRTQAGLAYVRDLELKVFHTRNVVGWLVHEMGELVRLVFTELTADKGFNAPATRKDVLKLGAALPVNYNFHPAHTPLPFKPFIPFPGDNNVYKPPF